MSARRGRDQENGMKTQDTDTQGTQASPEEQELERVRTRMAAIRHKVMVLSGKGGVGKSTVAAHLAFALASRGLKTGILDVDIHGPSIPKILGLEGRALHVARSAILPVESVRGLKAMSIGFLIGGERDAAVIWRGPMKYKAIRQFLADVEWGDLDYLVVDAPPGTGDEPLSIAQLVPGADGSVIVTTPQEVALQDVRRCVQFCGKVGLRVIGVVENMSGMVCPHCGQHLAPFGSGGGEAMARDMGVAFLGRIPLEPRVVEACDAGMPQLLLDAGGEVGRAFAKVVDRILTGG
jgi:Mrp family chromosome partitioning ATPase